MVVKLNTFLHQLISLEIGARGKSQKKKTKYKSSLLDWLRRKGKTK